MEFKLHAPYEPTGDQPKAIEKLVKGFKEGNQFETLLGVTGSGKTFTMANVIQALNKPTLIISHNKTLAGQLYGEMKEFFPENAVEYFVSYYDYYQPEAYVPQSDTYIAKDSAVNDEIDKLRLSATAALAERKDVIIVASVSCIYGIGSPDDYMNMMVSLRPGMEIDRDDVIKGLIDMQYTRNEMDFKRGTFRVHGDVLEIFPANNTDTAIRVEFFGDEIDRITEVDVLTGEIKCILKHAAVFPASHYVVPQEKMNAACDRIEAELEERVRYFKGEDKLLEAQRIAERTNFDIEMMKETGFCSGIENYSRHLANDEIDKLRLSATAALAERKDVIIVASVSCIYGIGSPDDYMNMMVSLRPGMEIDRDDVIKGLIDMQYTRNEMDFKRGTFRVHGDVLEIFPANNTDTAIRVEFFGDEIDRITEVDVLTGEIKCILKHAAVFPASHYVVPQEKMNAACDRIEAELEERVRYFKGEDKLLEAQRIAERTNFDIEMMKETGFCSGIENYSRHLAGRAEGEMPETLMDYFPDDFLIIVDESHITIPQVRGMYAGDRSRKQTLVDYGFRLPSALDNRPLNFEEFESKIDQMLFVSATPNVYENEHELLRVEQIIRPTGLLDPEISVRPVEGQIDDLIGEVNKETKNHHKVLITTLTKRMAEDLTQYMSELGIRVKYLHSDIDTLERAEIIRDLRLDVFDVLVGINLLREGLDIPEITLVAILDADKEGFLRSETSLIQTIGRAARNSEGHVIMYADKITDSMRVAIDETERRRKLQQAYNEEHGITPKTIQKSVRDLIAISKKVAAEEMEFDKDPESMSRRELEKLIGDIQKKMKKAAAELNFEAAAEYRDKMVKLKNMLRDIEE